MNNRTTLTVDATDLEILRAEARRRKVSLNTVLREVVAEAAAERRSLRPRPHFGLWASNDANLAQLAADDEDSPAAGRLES